MKWETERNCQPRENDDWKFGICNPRPHVRTRREIAKTNQNKFVSYFCRLPHIQWKDVSPRKCALTEISIEIKSLRSDGAMIFACNRFSATLTGGQYQGHERMIYFHSIDWHMSGLCMPTNAGEEKGKQKERSNNVMHWNGSALRIRHTDERYL